MNKITLNDAEDWLESRKAKITGTFAAYLMGEGYTQKSARQLVEIFHSGENKSFTPEQQEKIDFGKNAEQHLRELFALEYSVKIEHYDNTLFVSDIDNRICGSVDGLIHSRLGIGILEIKTSTCNCTSSFMCQSASTKWHTIPRCYLWQVLHYMLVTEAEYACVRAYNRISCKNKDCDKFSSCEYKSYKKIVDFQIFRKDYEEELDALKDACLAFLRAIDDGRLPSIAIHI